MCSLPSQVVVRKASCLPQFISTCETVSGPMPQGHSSVSAAWILFRYCRRAIFPVRIWISTADSSLLSPLYNWRDLRSTSGSSCRSWCPCFAFAHSFFQSSFALARAHLVTADCSGCSGGNVGARCPRLPSARHPVASFASRSASSFPGIPRWAGIQCKATCSINPFKSSSTCRTMCCPEASRGFCSAPWLSVKMIASHPASWASSRARASPTSSATGTVYSLSVPR